jgi:hypothetical protein
MRLLVCWCDSLRDALRVSDHPSIFINVFHHESLVTVNHRSIRHPSRRQTRKSCRTRYGRGFLHPPFLLSYLLAPQPDKLEYPSDIAISQQAKDLIGGLLVKPALRLGSGPTGVDELRHHPFFSVHSILSVMIASSFIPCCRHRQLTGTTSDTTHLRLFPTHSTWTQSLPIL